LLWYIIIPVQINPVLSPFHGGRSQKSQGDACTYQEPRAEGSYQLSDLGLFDFQIGGKFELWVPDVSPVQMINWKRENKDKSSSTTIMVTVRFLVYWGHKNGKILYHPRPRQLCLGHLGFSSFFKFILQINFKNGAPLLGHSTFFYVFLGWRIPNLITGLSGW